MTWGKCCSDSWFLDTLSREEGFNISAVFRTRGIVGSTDQSLTTTIMWQTDSKNVSNWKFLDYLFTEITENVYDLKYNYNNKYNW